ncbi:uncharacterized protein ASCRUDRAFT_79392 [Ascoidea rubescens DSM 1968]|uniref:Uncharacterized protein n=1 Tax=Ascoidea rubescens DSM 1968 TaxID=1344418 RepID=A0A1D2VMC1_9ASCO|nr:hypothetical protein ASCRUDRAFT_79392 [Ascoidea rubescens DSM 1968]ODV62724.1 hypothetical protein ASCRUDRAFT_79392 [Ascoidea rubescens DSM 1968]
MFLAHEKYLRIDLMHINLFDSRSLSHLENLFVTDKDMECDIENLENLLLLKTKIKNFFLILYDEYHWSAKVRKFLKLLISDDLTNLTSFNLFSFSGDLPYALENISFNINQCSCLVNLRELDL